MKELSDRVFIDSNNAKSLLDRGYSAADLHVHSSASYDVIPSKNVSPQAILEKERSRGLLPIITDHDTMDAVHLFDTTGVEIKIKPREIGHTVHVNVYTLNSAQFNDLENIASTGDMSEFLSYINNLGLPFQYNHPFWHEPGERLNISGVRELAKKFPVIELNAGRIKPLNDHAYRLAEELGKGITSTTDSHIGEPGKAVTLAKGRDFLEFWDNVIHGNAYVVRYDMTIPRIVHEIRTRIMQYMDCSLEELSKKDMKTGIGIADAIIDHLTSDIYKSNKALKKAVSSTVGNIIGPIVATALLVVPQNITAYDVNKSLVNDMASFPEKIGTSPIISYSQ